MKTTHISHPTRFEHKVNKKPPSHSVGLSVFPFFIFFLFNGLGVTWGLPPSIKSTMLCWHHRFAGKNTRKVWSFAPLCTFWCIWKKSEIFWRVTSFAWWSLKIHSLSFCIHYNGLSWEGSLSLLDSVDQVGLSWGCQHSSWLLICSSF